MTEHNADEKKPAQGGLLGWRMTSLASKHLGKVVFGGRHARFAFNAACLRPQRPFFVKVAFASLAVGIYGVSHATAMRSAAQGQNDVDIGLRQRAMLMVGDRRGNPAKFTNAAIPVVSENIQSVPKDGSEQKGEDSNAHAVAVEPEENFFNQHGILWALICFIAGMWNGGGFQSLRRKSFRS